jgi:hypothetical protein
MLLKHADTLEYLEPHSTMAKKIPKGWIERTLRQT